MIRKNVDDNYYYDYDSFINKQSREEEEKRKKKQQEEILAGKKAQIDSMFNKVEPINKKTSQNFMGKPNPATNRTPEDALKEMLSPVEKAKYQELSAKLAPPPLSTVDKTKQALMSIPAGAMDSMSRYVLQRGLDELEPYKDDEIAKETIDKAKKTLAMNEDDRKRAFLGENYQPNTATDIGFGAGKMAPMLAAGAAAGPRMAAQTVAGGLVGAAEGYGETGTLRGAIQGGLSGTAFMGVLAPMSAAARTLATAKGLRPLASQFAGDVMGGIAGTEASGLVNMGFGAYDNGSQGALDAIPKPMDYATSVLATAGLGTGPKAIASAGNKLGGILKGLKTPTPVEEVNTPPVKDRFSKATTMKVSKPVKTTDKLEIPIDPENPKPKKELKATTVDKIFKIKQDKLPEVQEIKNKVLKDIPKATETMNKLKGVKSSEVPPQFKGNLEPDQVTNKFENRLFAEPEKEPYRFENDEIETKYQETKKGKPKEGFFKKLKAGIEDTVHRFTRPIRTLPVNGETAKAYFELNRYENIRNIVSDDAIRTLKTELSKLDYDKFDIFSRKVVLDDFAAEVKLGSTVLPNKFTPEYVASELPRIEKEITPEVREALNSRKQNRKQTIDKLVDAMKQIGVNLENTFGKEDYFRHQVLDKMNETNANIKGTGNKLQTPPRRDFMKQRSGKHEGDISQNYLQAEYEVLAQMKYDTEVAKMIKAIKYNYDISAEIKTKAKKEGVKDWETLIPEGYSKWSPKENTFYRATPVTDREAIKLTEELLAGLGVDSETFNKILNKSEVSIKTRGPQYVMKDDLVKTLNNLFVNKDQSSGAKVAQQTLNAWKIWQTGGNPKQFLKYNMRNISANVDTGLFNPTGVTKVSKAAKEIYDATVHGKFSPELNKYREMGGFTNLLLAQDIQGINKIDAFKKFADRDAAFYAKAPMRGLEKIWGGMKTTTNSLEMITKYANYLDYKQQMLKSKDGLPRNYGASKPEVIKGLKNIDERAFELANDLFGNYSKVSEAGKAISKYIIPFNRWAETNLKRHVQLIRNAYNNAELARGIGNKILAGAPITAKVALSVGKTSIALSGYSTAIALWNSTGYRKELEDKIPANDRNRLHMILGSDSEGNPIYFSRMGSVTDFLEWFGLGDLPMELVDVMNGKTTLKEAYAPNKLIEKAKQPFNKLTGSVSPYIKAPIELSTGKTYYPDVTKGRPIRDVGQYLAGNIGLRAEYDKLAGKPTKDYSKDGLLGFVAYKSEADKTAYDNTKNLVSDFKKQIGKYNEGYSENQRTDSLYNYKLALKYNDKKALEKYKKEYIANGGNIKGLNASTESLHPLYGLAAKDRPKFTRNLTADERKALDTAIEYYKKIISNK